MARSKEKPLAVIETDACQTTDGEREEINERFWRAVERIGKRNADKDPDEVLRVVTEAVEEVRQERYEREQRAKGGR